MNFTTNGEIVSIQQADQFQPGHSAYECGFFAVTMARSMAQIGQNPTLSPQQIVNQAEAAYARYDGNNSASNESGMSLQQLYDLLQEVGLHWQAIAMDADTIRAWVYAGFPVIVAVAETSVHDLALGDAVPYPWNPVGNHIIVITGVDTSNNFLVRDSANITPAGVLRPGPRTYDATQLCFVSATAVIPQWKARPDANFDPRKEPMMIDLTMANVAFYFDDDSGNWKCKQTGFSIHGGILQFYQSFGGDALCGLTYLGLPLSNEIAFEQGKPMVKQYFERGVVAYDPQHQEDNPPLARDIYLMHVHEQSYDQQQALIAQLQQQLNNLQKLAAQTNPASTPGAAN
ncbi:MAG TPA: C39 family peptidase [Ktedonobacteraceae bacterium]|nr:C39 family peptidase [Ktedonobacteraceae bacterium]